MRRAPTDRPHDRPPGNLARPERTRTNSPADVVPPCPPSPLLAMSPKVHAATHFMHSRPPPPRPPQALAYVQSLPRAPPRPWCDYHQTTCSPQDCGVCADLLSWHHRYGHYPDHLRD
eukprot:15680122-Heterocapsa_arctica.AAC.1